MRNIHSLYLGVWRLRTNDRSYFVNGEKFAPRASSFRHDFRAVMGGALAFSFVAASLTHMFGVHAGTGGLLTLAAGIVGGISGKALLILSFAPLYWGRGITFDRIFSFKRRAASGGRRYCCNLAQTPTAFDAPAAQVGLCLGVYRRRNTLRDVHDAVCALLEKYDLSRTSFDWIWGQSSKCCLHFSNI